MTTVEVRIEEHSLNIRYFALRKTSKQEIVHGANFGFQGELDDVVIVKCKQSSDLLVVVRIFLNNCCPGLHPKALLVYLYVNIVPDYWT